MKQIVATKTFSQGLAIAPAFVLASEDISVADYRVCNEEDVSKEKARFDQAVQAVTADLETLAADNAIFEGHKSIVGDEIIREAVYTRISSEKLNVEKAVEASIAEIKAMFDAMDDEYMRERAADVADVGKRLIAALQGKSMNRFAGLNKASIIVAEDLAPSDTATLPLEYVAGFITEKGGVTSHVCIMARSMGLPALVGVSGILDEVEDGMTVAFDAKTGEICLEPDSEYRAKFMETKQAFEATVQSLKDNSQLPVVTKDGVEKKVYANLGSVSGIDLVLENNADGIGLFRSEFLFMENDHFPTEEEQFLAYKEVVTKLKKDLIIRTLDIGGDKGLSYFDFPTEENPFLGYRAVRLCLDKIDVFKTQLRALLRASAFGPIRVMIPMIISVEELRKVKQLIEECKDELRAENIDFNNELSVGIMMETAASVLLADELAEEADFFSIGTNDLTQYILSVDRGNEGIAHLYNSFHPAVLRAIARIIEAGKRAGIEVGMCGEFAADEKACELLLGLGLDEYSIAPGEIPKLKEKLRTLSESEAKIKAGKVLECKTVEEVMAVLINKE